jgi:hypothetical protein
MANISTTEDFIIMLTLPALLAIAGQLCWFIGKHKTLLKRAAGFTGFESKLILGSVILYMFAIFSLGLTIDDWLVPYAYRGGLGFLLLIIVAFLVSWRMGRFNNNKLEKTIALLLIFGVSFLIIVVGLFRAYF